MTPASRPAADTLRDLSAVLDTGVVLLDENLDGVVDRIGLELLLAPEPTEAEAAAAANLAARLGFETASSDLQGAGVVSPARSYADPVMLVGGGAVAAAGLPVAMAEGLGPGEGALVRLSPGARFQSGGVALVGYDATGLLEAASYGAARYPSVWATDGDRWRDAADAVRSWADTLALPDAVVTLDRIVVGSARPGVARATVTVSVPDSVFARTVEALEAPDNDSTEVPTAGDLVPRGVRRLDVRVSAPGQERTVPVAPTSPSSPRTEAPSGPGPDPTLSLARLYDVDGLYRDTNRDLVPDESVGFVSLAGSGAAEEVTALATRIGLETAGLRLPLVEVAAQDDELWTRGFPLLVGREHYQVGRLVADGLVPGDQAPGVGRIHVVDDPDEERDALVITGGDEDGLTAAVGWLARRAPYLWTHGKGEYRLADAEEEVRRFLQARSPGGQVALALAKLDGWLERLDGSPERIEIELAALEAPEGLAGLIRSGVDARFPNADVQVETFPTGFGVGDTIFVQDWEVAWEVDDVRRALAAELYPEAESGRTLTVEVRVSEPPAVRRALEGEIRDSLEARGATDFRVQVLSAYKQGYSWLEDAVLPRLRSLPVAAVDLTYHTLQESDEVRWQTIAAETRWLQEIYPVDAVLARELGIPDSAIAFHPTRTADPVYTVVAKDSAGAEVFRETFDPRYVVRPFFDLFPEYEQVRVTTGWLTATAGADTLVNRRVLTDPERFWDRLQTETFGRIVDYVMDTQEGDPSPANAPYFDEFRVDLRLSEPDRRIGVDEEVISSLEALHEDIYFETLTLFDLIGARYQTSLPYPGRVLPYIDPTGEGQPGRARITFTGKRRANPEVILRTWAGGGADPRLERYDLSPLPTDAPRIVGVTVKAGAEELGELRARTFVSDSVERIAEFSGRSSEAAIDRQFLSAELLVRMLGRLGDLHEAGLFLDVLAWDRVAELVLEARLEDDQGGWTRTTRLLRSSAPASTDNPRLLAEDWDPASGERLVQWDTPIPPAENDSILARLNHVPGVDVYYMTRSFLGQPVWAMDLLPPHPGRYLSQAKLNALRPTLFLSGRQHANEVSSTSHILRLAELLVTDSTYRSHLQSVNVVLHPITNPDGARLAVEMQETNPDFMLHAGYLGALGVDATSGERDPDAIYPESQVRRRLRETWLPDIYINMHGYPSHEWVQYFAGYSAWVRSRRGTQRSWWAPRGWFIPGLSWVDDDENPEYRTAQFAILDSLASAITREEEVEAMNRRLYARYRKYGEQDRDEFTEYFHEGVLVNLRLRGAEDIGTGLYSPRITYFATTTEAPDETARGDWLELVATAGLAHSTALLEYLSEGKYDVEREAEAVQGGVVRKLYRLKPVLPPDDDNSDDAGSGAGVDSETPSRRRRPGPRHDR